MLQSASMRTAGWKKCSGGKSMGRTRKQLTACGLLAAICFTSVAFWPVLQSALAKGDQIPNLGAVGFGWFEVGDDFLPPSSGPGPIVSDPSHPYHSNASGLQSTYRVADVRNPILQPWVVERLTKTNADVLSGKVPFNARERCWPAGVPGFEVFTLLRPIYFLQTPKEVIIVNEGDYQVRHVYLNVRHSSNPKRSWYGESVGHYENGDTLVVDTIGMNDRTYIDNYLTPHTTRLHVVERFTLTDSNARPAGATAETEDRFKLSTGGKTLKVSITVDDPGAFRTVWSAIQIYRQEYQGDWDETICAENDGSYFNYEVVPIPQAVTSDF
jgi:hypothetical protein